MRVLELEDATAPLCGAKAAACGELLRLARSCQDALAGEGGWGLAHCVVWGARWVQIWFW